MTSENHQNVLIVLHRSGKVIGACSAKCYNDPGFHCTCICGGVNHGVGRRQASRNALAGISIDWKATWAKLPQSECRVIVPRGTKRYAQQLDLFDKHTEAAMEPKPCPPVRHQF